MISFSNKIKLVTLLAGFISMELEILGTRILTPIFGSTIYVWTSLIGVTLIFLAFGYWYGGKLADKKKITINILGIIIFFLGAYIVLFPYISKLLLVLVIDLGIIIGPLISSFIILSFPVFFLGFVVPSSVKLITQSLEKVGTRAGEIYSLATIGSIIGTFVTGFFLIPYLGVTKSSLITGISLMLLSSLIMKPKLRPLFLLIIPLLAVLLITPSMPSEILETFNSYYNQVRVVQHGEHLRLYAGIIPQTAINIKTKENEISYIKYFEVPFILNYNYEKALMVGLAGGYNAKQLVEKYDIKLDVIEIEPRMLDLARKYFYWEDEANVYFDDARHYLRQSKDKYDIIIYDIGYVYPAWHLYTKEAFQEMYNHLSPDGMLLFNVFTAKEGKYSQLTQTLYKTLQQVFYDIIILRNPDGNPKETQSMVILASKERIDEKKLIFLLNDSQYSGPPIEKIIEDNSTFRADENIGVTTDDHPLAEFYDYKNLGDWGTVGKSSLSYFLPY